MGTAENSHPSADKGEVLATAREFIAEMVRASTAPVVDLDDFGPQFAREHPDLQVKLAAIYDQPGYSWLTYVNRYVRTVVDQDGSHRWSPADKRWHRQ